MKAEPGQEDGGGPGQGQAPDERRAKMIQPISPKLTPRELEICQALCEGLPNKGIADRLVISAGTVQAHLKSIYLKFGTHSRAHAVATFLRSYRVQGTAFVGYRSTPRRVKLCP